MKFIILTESEAQQVRGPSLQPRGTDGYYILPLAVLADPVHAEHHDFLKSLPQEEVELSDAEE